MPDPALFAIGLVVTIAVAIAVGLVGFMDVDAAGDELPGTETTGERP